MTLKVAWLVSQPPITFDYNLFRRADLVVTSLICSLGGWGRRGGNAVVVGGLNICAPANNGGTRV